MSFNYHLKMSTKPSTGQLLKLFFLSKNKFPFFHVYSNEISGHFDQLLFFTAFWKSKFDYNHPVYYNLEKRTGFNMYDTYLYSSALQSFILKHWCSLILKLEFDISNLFKGNFSIYLFLNRLAMILVAIDRCVQIVIAKKVISNLTKFKPIIYMNLYGVNSSEIKRLTFH